MAAEYGVADFLAKPVEFEHLKAQLRQLPGVPDWGSLSLDRMSVYSRPSIDPGPDEGQLSADCLDDLRFTPFAGIG